MLGWGEFELEVMRDRSDNVVIVCSIENLDPMGVHTGDSVCVAPQQTLTDKQYQALRDQAIAVIRAVGVADRRLERPVRGQPRDRRDRRDRDEPARLALERAGEQGDRLPDREDRGAAGGRVHAAGDPQRHHQGDAGELRAGDRLLRREVAAVRVREVPGRRGRADHAHEVGRRGDGARAHLQAGVREGAALARARSPLEPAARRRGAPRRSSRYPAPTGSTTCSRRCAAARRATSSTAARASTPGSCASSRELRRRPRGDVRRRADVQGGRHLRRRVRRADAVLLLGLGAGRAGRT